MTPVAWYGHYPPFKYKLERFINSGTVDRDQSGPSVSMADFLVFTPGWQVVSNTFRPPYYYGNSCTEIIGMVCGKWALSSSLELGGLTYELSYLL